MLVKANIRAKPERVVLRKEEILDYNEVLVVPLLRCEILPYNIKPNKSTIKSVSIRKSTRLSRHGIVQCNNCNSLQDIDCKYCKKCAFEIN